MATYKDIVRQSSKLIEASELKDSLIPLWDLIEWQGHAENLNTGAELDRKGDAIIHLYPALEQTHDAYKKVLCEFGRFVLIRAGDRGKAIWENKLDVPTPDQIKLAKSKLEDEALRKMCKTYKDVLDSYPDRGNSTSRLVFINVMNALLANNIAYPDSIGVDIMTWGPTAEYANLKKYHCLVPLVSAYSPADVYSDYGHAFAALLIDGLANIRDSSVGYALRGIVQRIARIASPA